MSACWSWIRHGPLALVDADMPVIAVAPNNDVLKKLQSNLMEVCARGSAGTSVQFAADQFATAAIRNSADNSIALNQWQHVAVVGDGSSDGSKINIYINGLVANDTLHTPTSGSGAAQSDTGTPFTIGNRTLDKASMKTRAPEGFDIVKGCNLSGM